MTAMSGAGETMAAICADDGGAMAIGGGQCGYGRYRMILWYDNPTQLTIDT